MRIVLSYLVLLDSIEQVLHLDASLPLVRLVFDEWMLEKLVSVGPLMIVLDQDCFNEVLEFGAPPFRFESGWWIPGDQEQSTHRMHIAQWRLRFRHLQGCDTQAPKI